jgi:hypothetical protein
MGISSYFVLVVLYELATPRARKEATMSDNTPSPAALPGTTAPLKYDPERYKSALGDLELSEEQSLELLSTLWSIMQNMVELGFSVSDSKICESIFEPFIEAANPEDSAVESPQNQPNCLGSKGAR